MAEIQSEFIKAKNPPGARLTEDVRTLKKFGVTSVSARYAVNEPDAVILEHYRNRLGHNGWRFVSTVKGGDHFGESYCKNKLLATVELLNSGPPSAKRVRILDQLG